MKEMAYKSIYKCRLCQKEFNGVTFNIPSVPFPIGPTYGYHHCEDGRCGIGDVLGSYTVEKEEAE